MYKIIIKKKTGKQEWQPGNPLNGFIDECKIVDGDVSNILAALGYNIQGISFIECGSIRCRHTEYETKIIKYLLGLFFLNAS